MTVGEVKALAAKYAAETLLDHFKERMDDLERKLAKRDGRLDRVRITVFEKAKLMKADLTGAIIEDASFEGADMTKAKLPEPEAA